MTEHSKRDVRIDELAGAKIEQPTDAIIEVTSTGICGSVLYRHELL